MQEKWQKNVWRYELEMNKNMKDSYKVKKVLYGGGDGSAINMLTQ